MERLPVRPGTRRCISEIRRRIFGKFVFVRGGALHFQFVEQDRRSNNAMRDVQRTAIDVCVISAGDQAAAQCPRVQVSEAGAAHQFLVSILGLNSVEQARR